MPQLIPILIGSVLVGASLCLLCCLVLTGRQRSRRRHQTERILAIQRKIDAVLADDSAIPPREPFSTSLKEATLTTNLQRPRLDAMAKVDRQIPEKYRIFAKIAEQGMDSAQAATILGISRAEAAQLLNIFHMAKISH
ncbi:MAG: hypothetical protein FWD79_04900 [Desulfobulbus sp.]|nr:hypothetical protein [Desulfobulbus sp.]